MRDPGNKLKPAYGHSLIGRPESEWELLQVHLADVAERAERFANAFDAPEWGQIAGQWHDVGKHSAAFQSYIRQTGRQSGRGPDHSTAGAKLAQAQFGDRGLGISYVIAGHHGGLPDWSDPKGGVSGLRDRLKKQAPEIQDALDRMPHSLSDEPILVTPSVLASLTKDCTDPGLRAALFVRMLFSCLVDADYLATEAFIDTHRSSLRRADSIDMGQLLDALNATLKRVSTRPSRIVMPPAAQRW
jgi:CRISPR-associated endonuclease/helicase Cas3